MTNELKDSQLICDSCGHSTWLVGELWDDGQLSNFDKILENSASKKKKKYAKKPVSMLLS